MTPEDKLINDLAWKMIEAHEDNSVAWQDLARIAFNAGLEEAVHIAAKEASKHKEVQHELTGPHGEAGEEAMMACASVWACEGVAAAIARARLSQKEETREAIRQ